MRGLGWRLVADFQSQTSGINLGNAGSFTARPIVSDGAEMLLHGGSSKDSELQGLGTPEEIALFVQQQNALTAQAKREEAQQHVRHLKFDLAQRFVLLLLAVALAVVLLIGALGDPELLKAALGGGGLAMLAGCLYRWSAQERTKPE
ncbi:MAG TPA: hypothetical protein VFP21_06660 [Solirubrobacterales bacterium]|nr:hypothetical protein [Solirubrobacterales bacterium]